MVKPRYKNPSKNFSDLSQPLNIRDIRGSNFDKKGVCEIYQLDIENIFPYTKQARKRFDENELDNLAASIESVGIVTPLLVIQSSERDRFYVINGERRLRAAKKIGLTHIPCIIENDNKKTEIIALIDNIQRADLHPIELASAYSSLLNDPLYADKKDLSKKMGVSYTVIIEILKLNILPEEIKTYSLNNNIRGRALFRKLLKCKDIDSMKNLLKIDKKKEEIKRRKNILNVSIINGEIEIKKYVEKITDKQKRTLIEKFNEYINSLELNIK